LLVQHPLLGKDRLARCADLAYIYDGMAISSRSRPTKQQLLTAVGRPVPDIIAVDLKVLFCGINPGLYSGAVGHHFARPGNRFWIALFHAGFTDRLLEPAEETRLLDFGCGITNIVNYATAQANELSRDELRVGVEMLKKKVLRFRPRVLAVLGIDAYRKGFHTPGAAVGEQQEKIGAAHVWVLPNPSGINANYQLADLVRLLVTLRNSVEK
jgi:TDG/mug DNA glycosylase family protein